VTSGLSL